MTPNELRLKRAALAAEARRIVKAAEDGNRNLSAEEQADFDSKMAEIDALGVRAAQVERVEALERFLAESAGRVSNPLPHQDPANARQKPYSVMKAIRQQLGAREGRDRLDGLELEVHAEMQKRRGGRPAQGVLVPWDLPSGPALRSGSPERRALDTTQGVGSIPTILDGTMIDALRARLITAAMGAKVLNDMRGLFAIPRQSGVGTSYWVAEGVSVTASNQVIDQVPFTPRTVGALTDYTRRFLEQTNQDSEAFLRDDLMAIIARAVDTAALNGLGASNQPKGILQTSAVATVAIGTNGGFPTWATLVNLESAVANLNADLGNLAYVVNSADRGILKQTPKIGSTFPFFLWDTGSPDAPLNGYRSGVTNLLPNNLTKGSGNNLSPMIFGNWADLVIAFWSGIDLLVDPYTGGAAGTVRIICLQDADVNLRHPESFAKCVDVQTQ